MKVSIFHVRAASCRRRPEASDPDLDDLLAVYEARAGEHPYSPIHLEMRRPLRPLGLRRYLAGPEAGGSSMTHESNPDHKAEELRVALA